MAKKSKKTRMKKISIELSQDNYDEIYEELFEEIMNGFAYEYGDDDGEEDYLDPKDRAKEYFEDKTPSDIIEEYLLWIKK